jgi:CHAT domain-containing protein
MKMRILHVVLMLFLFSFSGNSQSIKKTAEQFWEAVENENDEEIISNGTILIAYIEQNNFTLDSTTAEIRRYTALAYSNRGDFQSSLRLNLKTLEQIELRWSKVNAFYELILFYVFENYWELGDYFKSLEYGLQALDIFEQVFGKSHPDYAMYLYNIALVHSGLGDYSQSLKFNLQVIEFLAKTQRKENPYYNFALNNIAVDYSNLGDYSKALEYNFLTLAIREKIFGKEHADYASSLNNIAGIYLELGDYTKSLEYNLQALEIREKMFGKEHPDYAASLSNIAANYSNIGDYTKSFEYNLQALEIRDIVFGKEHPDYAASLNNIAGIYFALGEYIKSLDYNLRALAIREEVLGNEHPDYALSLNNIASNYSYLGDYSKSLKYNLRALEIYENTLGKDHPDYAIFLENGAINYYNLRDYPLASKYFKESYSTKEKSFRNNQFGLNNNLISTYKKSLENSLFVNAGMLSKDTTNAQFIATSWLNLNGLLASNQKNLEQEIISSGDTIAIATMQELKLSKLQLHKYQELTLQEKQKRGIDEAALKEKIDAQERDLSQKLKSFANFNRYFNPGDVSSNLQSNEYFVDIVRAPHFNFTTKKWTDSTQYLVFIYSSQDTVVQYLFIQDGFGLEDDAVDNYKAFTSGEYRNEQSPDPLSYDRFWLPIAEKIGNAKTIYVSSNGIYNKINLNTLYNPTTGKYLIEEMDIRLVNSARDFILQKEKQEIKYNNNTITLVGYPNYNATNEPIEQTDLLAGTRDLATFWIDSLTRGGFTAALLPGTKKEIQTISDLFQLKKWEIHRYLENEANESNVKALQHPRILHIATHGYFFEDIPNELDDINQSFMGMDRQTVVQDPMLRSGLLLVGANITLKGEEQKGENGLLSAAEASLLNLRGTELVVLSACETGRGEVKNSEGVYGLRKAFTDAGAQNIIMSLWKVDDEVTKEFMIRFYEIWLNDQTSIREAFNQTQLEIKAKYPQPYYWGAFILVGV